MLIPVKVWLSYEERIGEGSNKVQRKYGSQSLLKEFSPMLDETFQIELIHTDTYSLQILTFLSQT